MGSSNIPIKSFASPQHLDLVLEAAKTGLWSWDIKTNEVTWSKEVEKIFGLRPRTFAGTYEAYIELIHKDDRKKVAAIINDTLESGKAYQIEHRLILTDGSIRWIAGQGKLFYDNNGEPISIMGIVIDITEQKNAEQHLIESEERFRAFSEASIEAIAFTDNGCVVDTNTALQKLLGYSAEELIGRPISDFIVPEDLELVNSKIKSGSERPYEHRALCKNGNIKYVEAYGKNTHYQGKICRMTALLDITARKNAEMALQKNQMLMHSIIDNSPAIIFLKDLGGRYMLVNKKFYDVFGLQNKQVIGSTGKESIDPKVFKNLQLTDAEVLKKNRPYEFELPIYSVQNGKRIFDVVKFPLFGSSGEIYGIGGIANDITERKKAEYDLGQHDQLVHNIVETSNDWFWAADQNGILNYTNPAVTEILGYQPEEIQGRSGFDFMHPEDVKRAMEVFSVSRKKKTGWKNLQLRWKCSNGDDRILESKAVPVIDEDGNVVGFRGSERDVTARIQMEDEKDRLEIQLRQSQKMEAVGQLAGGVAHDFNNILTVILGHIELASLTLYKPSINRDSLVNNLNEIQQSAQRAATLTSQLLAFSRRQISQPQILNMHQAILDMESMLRRLITEDINLEIVSDSNLKHVSIDPNQLQQIIMNLVINARDAMPEGGTITIESRNIHLDQRFVETHSGARAGFKVMLSISDTGCGMDAETVQRIFEPFYSTKPAGQGTGLGLSVVYGIVKQANGYVSVESKLQKGTVVKIYFPVRYTPIDEENIIQEREIKYFGGSETILVCEDDDTVRQLTVSILESAGYEVLGAAHGEQALDLARDKHKSIKLLVTDLIMPGINGHKLALAVSRIIPEIRIMYLSGYTADTISEHGIVDKEIEFLQKPFTRKELLLNVRRILDTELHGGVI